MMRAAILETVQSGGAADPAKSAHAIDFMFLSHSRRGARLPHGG
jgi:hypothetical protein